MGSASDFYNSLLASEIAIFGIIAAALVVFFEMIYAQLSYRGASTILKSWLLWVSISFGLATVLFTAAGSLLLSFPSFDFVSGVDSHSRDFFQNGYVGLTAVALLAISMILFLVLVVRNGKYLRPSRIALLLGERIKSSVLRDYLLHKYGIPRPDSYPYADKIYRSVGLDHSAGIAIKIHGEDREKTTEEIEERNQKETIVLQRLELYQEQYEKLIKSFDHGEDPFAALSMLLVRSVDSYDIPTVGDVIRLIERISVNFIEEYSKRLTNELWNPEDKILLNYVDHVLGLIRLHSEHCERGRHQHIQLQLLQVTQRLSAALMKQGLMTEEKLVMGFWKEIADQSAAPAPRLFCEFIRYYNDVFEYLVDKEEYEELLKDLFRHVGWLGERLLSKTGVEERPLMIDHTYTTQYDCLLEAILTYGHAINDKRPDMYPLIYFDAVHVVVLQCARLLQEQKDGATRRRLRDNLFSLIYTFVSFANAAIRTGNSDGAGLAVMRLKESYELLVQKEMNDLAEELIIVITELGGNAAGLSDRLTSVEFLDKAISDYIIDIVASARHTNKIAGAAMEIVIRGEGDHARRLEFLKRLGRRMQTNFGLNFDWGTGERLTKG
jgi:hypothetical protein